ncbi:Pyruvate phosphate dikinase, PEP/pyruvate binding domain [Candidatus Burarchaeum australiense]|nr:Pyruvate phosphate dikinase, PEP/pyruvate binding domain [Candidatus Burarchaeum australiense]
MFEFSTKAETLERLQGRLRKSEIPPLLHFTVREWKADAAAAVAKVRAKFVKGQKIVVRSSALNEDSQASSMAGCFRSVLDVDAASPAAITAAVEKVVGSYSEKRNSDDGNLVLVQQQVGKVQLSGVAFTRDLETGAPYYVINYDDLSGRTDVITSGSSGRQKIFTYCKLYGRTPSDKYMAQVIEAVREIEKATGCDSLDIEFVIAGDKLHTLQVRPITIAKQKVCTDKEFRDTLEHVKDFVRENDRPFPNLAGSNVAYGIMPDWNPAEIIGVDPKPLAFSLYRHLITDTVWPQAREEVGYKAIGYQPGICSLAGKPYVDIRMSFNTFLPASLSAATSEKLVNFYLRKLRRFQDFHDKVEFKVVYTCYVLDYGEIEKEMAAEGFSKAEIAEMKSCLFTLTDDILAGRVTSIEREVGLSEQMRKRREKIVASDIPLPSKIAQLGHDCKMYGTLPFSKLARFAFISAALMRSLLRKKIITQDEYDRFFASISTVATDFLHKLGELKRGAITRRQFMEEYGHLRPGTYDICSHTYAESFDGYVDLKNFTEPARGGKDFEFSAATKKKISAELKAHGFSVSADQLLAFVRKSTMARELSKLEFTKNLSLMLVYVEQYLSKHGLSREDLAFLTIDDILKFSHSSRIHDSLAGMKEKIGRNRNAYAMMKLFRFPPLIFMDRSVEYFTSTDMMPNYVTQKTVCAEVFDLSANSRPLELAGKIVLIQNADPGYDWIFSHDIAGLITEFGGAASHMTIRAAEFKMPAAIGCGATLFNFVKGCGKVELNCASKYIKAVM